MRAMVAETPGPFGSRSLIQRHLVVPEPGPGQLRLRIQACALCRTDLHIVEGELPVRLPGGVVPGHQVVGTVDAVGAGVEPGWLAQRVGVAWVHSTCGTCRQCRRGRENLCEQADFTGYSVPG